MDSPNPDVILDLLIVGAGPVGLTAALEAKRLGLSFRIIDRKQDRSVLDSRAVVVHPRVLELLEPIRGGALVSEIAETSIHLGGICVYLHNRFSWLPVCGRNDTTSTSNANGENENKNHNYNTHPHLLDLTEVAWGDTEYPNLYFLPQFETERILEKALVAEGGKVDYGISLEDLTQENGVVTSQLLNTYIDSTESLKSRWVLGADGGRSKTRDLIGAKLDRHRSDLYYIIADIVFKGDPPLASPSKGKCGHMFPDKTMAFLPLPPENAYRIAGQAPLGIKSKDDVVMDEKFFQDLLLEKTGRKFELELGAWQTIFEITHGASDYYRMGNVMLAGDASHIHSPIGGQGMNLGMQDVMNLLWKLAWSKRILKAASSEECYKKDQKVVDVIIETYHSERHSLGMEMVKQVGFATKMLAINNPLVKFFRDEVLRLTIPSEIAKMNFRKMGQLDLAYAPSSSTLLFGNTSWTAHYICSPGQRLPNIQLEDGSHLYSHIDRARHTWVFLNHSNNGDGDDDGTAEMTSWESKVVRTAAVGAEHQISVPIISEQAYAAPQVLLVRPDQFVAGVGASLEPLRVELRRAGMTDTAMTTM